jgi:hypothetical protein
MQGVERLSIVSKVLFDSRLIELRRENEDLKLEQKNTIDKLKLKVFWLEHDGHLKELLASVNDCQAGPKCCCENCYAVGRFDVYDKRVLYGVDCSFIPWFENEIVDFDMTSSVRNSTDVVTQFAVNPNGHINFSFWLRRLRPCRHHELRKVHQLFDWFHRLADLGDWPDWESYWE